MADERSRLLKRVQMYSFLLDDAALYLDTHPTDQAALEYYKKNNALYKRYKEEFEAKFGPLTRSALCPDATKWDWVEKPWPWENEV